LKELPACEWIHLATAVALSPARSDRAALKKRQQVENFPSLKMVEQAFGHQ